MRGLFITGTDTGVGKTVAAAALMHRYRAAAPLRYWKPIQTGIEIDDDTQTVHCLGECAEKEILDRGIRLKQPVSPHLAAQIARERIDLQQLRALVSDNDCPWIVEGAGGALVPINENELMVDWMAMLQLPVLIVARTALGTINHTLMTLEALRARSLEIAGVLMIGEPNRSNREAIEQYGKVAVIGEMSLLAPLNAESLRNWSCAHLDTRGHLLEWLR